ncbi:MAG TPA: DNA topoisomerase IB [Rhodoblastus sp.]|nr:DNA topoisomerase IB [Rhodoblastus sp.]
MDAFASSACASSAGLARAAGLSFSDDARPGVTRRRVGKGFAYYDARGALIRDKATIARIKAIAIPPAWEDVWIAPSSRGHIQATGRDARGRKQYRYHEDWTAHRETTKFALLPEFAAALPKLREAVEAHLRLRKVSRERVLAVVVTLLQQTLIRIGNASYARDNDSYGLTTLTQEHVEIDGGWLRFSFRGKSGKEWRVAVADRRIANVMLKCQELPGQALFRYIGENGEARDVASGDVNEYLRELTGFDFTAKTFRTWAGTVLAARALAMQPTAETKTGRKRATVAAVREVAARLGNTAAVCRASYIHPAIFEAYETGALHAAFKRAPEEVADWIEDEKRVLGLLRKAGKET